MILKRRGFLAGLAAALAAPAVVRAASIMPVKVPKLIFATEADLATVGLREPGVYVQLKEASRGEIDGARYTISAFVNWKKVVRTGLTLHELSLGVQMARTSEPLMMYGIQVERQPGPMEYVSTRLGLTLPQSVRTNLSPPPRLGARDLLPFQRRLELEVVVEPER